MNKPKEHTLKYYDSEEIENYIEEKYGLKKLENCWENEKLVLIHKSSLYELNGYHLIWYTAIVEEFGYDILIGVDL